MGRLISFTAGAVFHGSIDPEAKGQWRLMTPLEGVTAELDKNEVVETETGSKGAELVIKNSKTLAVGYLVEGGELQLLSRELYRTNGIALFISSTAQLTRWENSDIFEQVESGQYFHVIRKDSIIVHANGEKTNPLPFVYF